MRESHPHAAASPEALVRLALPPVLATLSKEPPPPAEASAWQLEVKYDGFRAVAAIAGGRVAMRSRKGLDLAARFPGVAAALARLRVESAVIDGEVVVLDAQGVPR